MLQAARLLLLWLLLVRTPTYSSTSHMRSRYHGRHISDVTSSSVANDNTLSQSDSPMTSRDVELWARWLRWMTDCKEVVTLIARDCSTGRSTVRSSVSMLLQLMRDLVLTLTSAADRSTGCTLAIDINGLRISPSFTARICLSDLVVCAWLVFSSTESEQSRRHSLGGSTVVCRSSRLLASSRRRRHVARWLNRPAYSSGDMVTFCDWRQSVTSRVHASNPCTYCAVLKPFSVSPDTTAEHSHTVVSK